MKRITIVIASLILSTASFCQQTDSSQPLTKKDYLAKSKEQKTIAWISLGVGATMFAIAAPGHVDFETLGVLVVIGGVATIASIPLFIAAAKNKKKAVSASALLKIEKVPVIQHGTFTNKSFPAVGLQISL